MGTWHGNNNDLIDKNNDNYNDNSNDNDNNNNINDNDDGDRFADLVLVGNALQVWVVHLMTKMIINNVK